jgi:glycosyltransferase involved in cell wall biosynthesis
LAGASARPSGGLNKEGTLPAVALMVSFLMVRPTPAVFFSGDGYRHSGEDCWLLEQTGMIEPAYYREAAGIDTSVDVAEHYLREGWRRGLDPNPRFEGRFLYPFYRSFGLHGPPAVSYVRLAALGRRPCPSYRDAVRQAARIWPSEFFDPVHYSAQCKSIGELDPALHYVIIGEGHGLTPSERFDPAFYADMYPDAAITGVNLLAHYLDHGRAEGRRPVSLAGKLTLGTERLDPDRETVLLIVHQATRTGAPVLAYNLGKRLRERYNLVTLLLDGGVLVDAFAAVSDALIGPITRSDWLLPEVDRIVGRIVDHYRVAYALANSIDTRIAFVPLALRSIPVVALVHEFPSHLSPPIEMGRALEWVTQTVFSANVVADAARAEYPALDKHTVHVIRQGPSEPPPAGRPADSDFAHRLRQSVRPNGMESAFIVLGCGTVTNRKGVDLFLACADAVAALAPQRPMRFVWIGRGTDADMDRRYAAELAAQRSRMAAPHTVALLDEVPDLEPAYASADLFFLSSRLDPLPNVGIDSALRGLPIVCFEGVSGFAELLAEHATTRPCVVPRFDVAAAAATIARLAADEGAHREIGEATRSLARAKFDMSAYVRRIDELGRTSMNVMQQRKRDIATIAADPTFDLALFRGYDQEAKDRSEAIAIYVTRSAAQGCNRQPTRNFYYRRPTPGFHPQIYAHEHAGVFDAAIVNPFAHFLRAGKPAGPWIHEIIKPEPAPASVPEQRVVIHGHFFYPELLGDYLQRLRPNRSRCDLLLSTSHEGKARELRELTRDWDRGRVLIRVVPNRGRDIGPFLTAFAADIVDRYDVVGHIHGKKSRHAESLLGETWREFLCQHLLGDIWPMMDIVLGRFATDRNLGLVFPEDPHLSDWDFNLDIAQCLARRMGLPGPLPPFFDFPIGNMFWARPEALQPLFALRLGWEDYPEEPVPIDGTILHAIERLLPFVVRHTGYKCAATHVPGVTW